MTHKLGITLSTDLVFVSWALRRHVSPTRFNDVFILYGVIKHGNRKPAIYRICHGHDNQRVVHVI